MLIILGGLPGTGKTTIARELARQLGALYLRIDSIEQAIRDFRAVSKPLDDAGYRIAYVIAEDNLRLGRTVVADSVNPIEVTNESKCFQAAVARRVRTAATNLSGDSLPTTVEIPAVEANADTPSPSKVVNITMGTAGNSRFK